MPKSIWENLIEQIESEHPEYGSVTIELVYHAGCIKHYIVNQSKRYHLEQNHENQE